MAEVTLNVGIVDATVEGHLCDVALDALTRALSYSQPGAYYTYRYQRTSWDGRVRLLRRRRFPSGLVDTVRTVLVDAGVDVAVRDERPPLRPSNPIKLDGIEFRAYQTAAIGALLSAQSGYAILPTGAGKTLIAAGLIKAVGKPAVVVVHTRALLRQTAKVFSEFFNTTTYYGEDKDVSGDVVVCLVQSLNAAARHGCIPEGLDRIRTLVVDEAHHVASTKTGGYGRDEHTSWYRCARLFQAAPYRFGFTASEPKKKPRMLLVGATGPKAYEIGLSELQQDGYVSDVEVNFVDVPEPKLGAMSWQKAYDLGIKKNDYRNGIVAQIAVRSATEKRTTLVVVEHIDHAMEIVAAIRQTEAYGGEPCRMRQVDGKSTTSEQVQAALDGLKTGRIDVLLATRQLLGEGIDVPAIDTVINAAALKSKISFQQTLGRGLRPSDNPLRFWDFFDMGNDHLFAHASARWNNARRLGLSPTRIPEFDF